MNDTDLIISPDVHRDERIPAHQVETRKWPVLHAGVVPKVDLSRWTFHIFGLVERPWQCTFDEFKALPRVRVKSDIHCVTRWSKLDNVWEGVSTRALLEKVKVDPSARYVMAHSEHGWTTNLPLDDFLGDDCLFAWSHDGKDLEPDHGWPLRLVVPRLYFWKSAKWVRGIELMDSDRPGFWESWAHGGYHMRGDPWTEQRFRDDG
jgi:DMSO/TMAO reductase YedYZ molybdopterin-dependent catalytic subunit